MLNLFAELFAEFICGIGSSIYPGFCPHLFTLLDFQESFIAMRDYILELVQEYFIAMRDYIVEFVQESSQGLYFRIGSMIPFAFIYPVGFSRVFTGIIF